MSTSARLATAAAATVLAAASLLSTAPAGAAPQPGGPPPAAPVDQPAPGKGDPDGDGIADDLEAALDRAAPGDRVGVIVQGTSPASARRAVPSLRTGHVYRLIPGFSGSVTAGQARALARVPGVTRVELDGVATVLDASGNLDYGVTAARAAASVADGTLDGSGIGICIIDTGIDPGHEQFAGKVAEWNDWVNDLTSAYDDHGHGTHVAGIAAGRPTGPANAAYGGVATGASLFVAKVIASTGSGSDADVVSAIEWCASDDRNVAGQRVHVISMSLGSPGSDGSDAASAATNAAVGLGKVVVAAAGNEGDAPGTIASPGVATGAITVGAGSDPSSLAGSADTDTSLYLAGFSSRGPTTNPVAPLKPDVVAPGLSVVAADAGTMSGYIAMSGTSMSTPFVAGVVALGLEAAPSATPAQVKSALQTSARDAGAAGPDNEWGHGLVDARSFVAALGAAPPGTAPWPDHLLLTGSVPSGGVESYPIGVTSAGSPLGVTLHTTNGAATCLLPVGGSCWYGYEWAPDLDAYLVSPSGATVAMSRCMLEASNGNCAAPGRFETLGVASAAAGTWTLRVESFSGSGSFQASVLGAVGPAAPPPPPPVAPTGLTASATSSTSVTLAWNDTSLDETGFDIERCIGVSCSSFAPVTTLGPGATAYEDSGRAASTTYGYRVRAVRGSDVSAWSTPAHASTPAPPPPPGAPSAPTNLTATPSSATRVNLTWTDLSSNETGFRLERCIGAKCTSTTQIATLGSNVTAYSDTTVRAGTTYRYKLQSFNATAFSAYTPLVTVKTPRR